MRDVLSIRRFLQEASDYTKRQRQAWTKQAGEYEGSPPQTAPPPTTHKNPPLISPYPRSRVAETWQERAKLVLDRLRIPTGDKERVMKVFTKYNDLMSTGLKTPYLDSIPYTVLGRTIVAFCQAGYILAPARYPSGNLVTPPGLKPGDHTTSHLTPDDVPGKESFGRGVAISPVYNLSGTLSHRLDPAAEIRRAVMGVAAPGILWAEEDGNIPKFDLPPNRVVGKEYREALRKYVTDKLVDIVNSPGHPCFDIAGTKYYLLAHPTQKQEPVVPTDAQNRSKYELTIPLMGGGILDVPKPPIPKEEPPRHFDQDLVGSGSSTSRRAGGVSIGTRPTTVNLDLGLTRAVTGTTPTDPKQERKRAIAFEIRRIQDTLNRGGLLPPAQDKLYQHLDALMAEKASLGESLSEEYTSPFAVSKYPEIVQKLYEMETDDNVFISRWKNSSLKVIHEEWAANFDQFITDMQHKAWVTEGARDIYFMLRNLDKEREKYDELSGRISKFRHAPTGTFTSDIARKIAQYRAELQQIYARLKSEDATPPQGVKRIEIPPAEKQQLRTRFLFLKAEIEKLHVQHRGYSPEEERWHVLNTAKALAAEEFNDPKLMPKIEWYIWLMGAEIAYGRRVEERKNLLGPKNYRSAVVVLPWQMPIRQARIGRPGYDTDEVASLGIGMHNLGQLERSVQGHRAFQGSAPSKGSVFKGSTSGMSKIWVVQTKDVLKYGINPANMGQYLRLSREQKTNYTTAINVCGLVGNKIEIKKTIHNFPMYVFRIGDGPSLALVPAITYLCWFDSPREGLGVAQRLIHGMSGALPPINPEYAQSKAAEIHSYNERIHTRDMYRASKKRRLFQAIPPGETITQRVYPDAQVFQAIRKILGDEILKERGIPLPPNMPTPPFVSRAMSSAPSKDFSNIPDSWAKPRVSLADPKIPPPIHLVKITHSPETGAHATLTQHFPVRQSASRIAQGRAFAQAWKDQDRTAAFLQRREQERLRNAQRLANAGAQLNPKAPENLETNVLRLQRELHDVWRQLQSDPKSPTLLARSAEIKRILQMQREEILRISREQKT